ncbi:hypothetical protein B0A55_10137 [Friedmanniomyces simplex]|uniref:A to I editase domain-containing protein n=1 Tax=Friedmanniomyces simplex TaxID=329884 RepID=A0A4U0WWL9_9PEZI|nr:hypothetical protein B0A55_10137 [Friedmanniomyces simplex]
MGDVRQIVLSDRPPNGEGEREDAADGQAQFFSLHDNITIHLYISDAPCGDASMELTMSAQPDATPWTTQPADDAMPGRGNFDLLGVVRRKPARPDAPPTLSKSCSDKLAMKQCTGLLSGVASLLVHPGNVYLRSVVVPEERYVVSAVGRAFGAGGRMAGVAMVGKEWRGGYGFTPFEVRTTRRAFEYSKPAAATARHDGVEVVGSNISTLSTLSGRLEVLISGVLQGRKQSDPKGTMHVDEECKYADLKVCPALQSRERVKQDVRELALKGWKRNTGDAEWRLGE